MLKLNKCTTKQCPKCLKFKKFSEYYMEQGGKYLKTECKECTKIRNKKYSTDNKKKVRERHKKYHLKHIKHFSNLAKEWQTNHKEYMQLLALIRCYKLQLEKCGHPFEEDRKVWVTYNKKTIDYLSNRLDKIKKVWKKHKKAYGKT